MMQFQIALRWTWHLAASADTSDDGVPSQNDQSTDKASGLRVLIVEDEGLVAMNMESALEEDGFQILGIVDSEADAVAAALRLKPDLVLMDITLRDGNGIAAARMILQRLATQLIFVSGTSDPVTLAAANELNPAAFIRKPFVTDSLARFVRNALRQKS